MIDKYFALLQEPLVRGPFVFTAARENRFIRKATVSKQHQVRPDVHQPIRVFLLDSNVSYESPCPSRRVFNPSEAGIKPADPKCKSRLCFIKKRQASGFGLIFLLSRYVRANRRPIPKVRRQEVQPLMKSPRIEQICLAVKQLLNFIGQWRRLPQRSPQPSACSIRKLAYRIATMRCCREMAGTGFPLLRQIRNRGDRLAAYS